MHSHPRDHLGLFIQRYILCRNSVLFKKGFFKVLQPPFLVLSHVIKRLSEVAHEQNESFPISSPHMSHAALLERAPLTWRAERLRRLREASSPRGRASSPPAVWGLSPSSGQRGCALTPLCPHGPVITAAAPPPPTPRGPDGRPGPGSAGSRAQP